MPSRSISVFQKLITEAHSWEKWLLHILSLENPTAVRLALSLQGWLRSAFSLEVGPLNLVPLFSVHLRERLEVSYLCALWGMHSSQKEATPSFSVLWEEKVTQLVAFSLGKGKGLENHRVWAHLLEQKWHLVSCEISAKQLGLLICLMMLNQTKSSEESWRGGTAP